MSVTFALVLASSEATFSRVSLYSACLVNLQGYDVMVEIAEPLGQPLLSVRLAESKLSVDQIGAQSLPNCISRGFCVLDLDCNYIYN